MTCPDCKKFDDATVTTIFDFNHNGEVCPRCERVYSPLLGANQLHFATQDGMKRRMVRDKAERADMSVSTHAVIDRFLEGRT
jgi:hypothetical protein